MTTAFLDDVLHHDMLRAVFQPIVATEWRDIVGYEGLVRGPVGTTLESPAALFEAARTQGRLFELERQCLRTVWASFVHLDLPGMLFLNVSPAMLMAPAWRQRVVLRDLADLDFDGRRAIVEITEEQAIGDFRRLRRLARLLGGHGCRLAIDDLGAGYASLRLWLELRPAFVKIDIAFVHGVEQDPVRQAFLCAVRDIARACHTRVIAEGIETQEELDCVRALGIDHAQGYHIGRPAARPALDVEPIPL
jgi:EAL domain-containing protein (putative c-di-GMP-specific phosphodiesterase class I)